MKKILSFLVLFPVLVFGQTQTENYIITKTYKVPSTTSITAPSISQASQNIIYFDGLGRPIQQIAHQQSGSGKDLVTPIQYDAFGRQPLDYLPYVPNISASLDYKSAALSDVGTFYNTATYENTLNPFSKKELEASPLNRVLKQAAPGNDWAIGSGHEIKLEYQTNTTSEVKLYQATATWNASLGLYDISDISFLNNGNYTANQLYKTRIFDENTAVTTSESSGLTEEFKNKEGQVVLKRKYGSDYSRPLTKHDTYYIYDQYGNLTYVLPPLVDTSATINQQTLDDLGYQYKYDFRNRLVEKKIPGKQWEFIVYDKLDRVVATGPAFSPFSDTAVGVQGWLINKYDVFNRPIYSGWENVSVSTADRTSKQTAQNNLTTTLNESKSSTGTIDGIATYYSNSVAPTSFKVLSVNYYDDYTFANAPSFPAYSYNGQSSYYNNSTLKPKGLPTGSWIRVPTTLASTAGESNYILYDYKARPIRNYTANYLGGFTRTDIDIDFSGKTTHTYTTHKRISTDTQILTEEFFTYTPQDRLLSHTHRINNGTVQLLAKNEYDELGQLTVKRVGGTNTTGASALQKVDFTYTIRGWLSRINNIDNLVQGADPKDLFTFRISYNSLTGYNWTPDGEPQALYNGNISETFWRTASDNLLRGYHFSYDNLDRFNYAQYGKSGLATQSYNEGASYDKNGNILRVYRYGDSDTQAGYIGIDNLYYTYADKSNKLLKVTDVFNNTSGFNDANTVGDDYTYDANGNLISDKNKGITNIIYNQLNLPIKITFGTTGNITYLYNAIGQKVQKSVFNFSISSIPIISHYLNGFQYIFYDNYSSYTTKLQLVPTSEGYYDFIKGKYVFNYTDHLGNVRLSYCDLNNDGVIANSEILEESNYYPFGLKQKGYNSNNTQTSYKYKYNGKELQDELGLNMYDYGARNYDPAIGRWMNMDPLAEHPNQIDKTAYNYAWNNPTNLTDPDGKCPTCPDGVYLPISEHVYTENLKRGMKTSNGWTVERVDTNQETGYRGALYKGEYDGKTEYIYATEGTNPFSLKDWKNNLQQVVSGDSPQYSESVEIAGQLSKDYEGVSYTGHSLGGGLASANALSVNGKAVTFNAAGLSANTKESLGLNGKKADITSYVVQGEIVSYLQGIIGIKAEGNIKTLPASYVPQIPFTKVDDLTRTIQRGINHTMGVVQEKF